MWSGVVNFKPKMWTQIEFQREDQTTCGKCQVEDGEVDEKIDEKIELISRKAAKADYITEGYFCPPGRSIMIFRKVPSLIETPCC
jgi:hypothetical protein